MSQQAIKVQGNQAVVSYDLRQITELLVKQNGLHDGMYDVAIEFQMAVGAVAIGSPSASTLPGAIIGISRIGLIRTVAPGPSTVNAAEVNPPSEESKQPA